MSDRVCAFCDTPVTHPGPLTCSQCGASLSDAHARTPAVAAIADGVFNTIVHPCGHRVVIGACKRDVEDPNDKPYDRHKKVGPEGVPPFVDLRQHMTTIEDQGELGSCTANAIAGAYEYLEKRITGNEGDVSRLFIYYLERKIEGTVEQDSGASLRNGMKVLHQYGVCSEDTWPYDVHSFKKEPHHHAYSEAKGHTIDEYYRVPVELHAMKTCLAEGYPFVFGTKIFSSFEEHGHHGRIGLPGSGEKNLGGHALLACGYSDHDEVFLVRNSWGTDWGEGGYCYFPYSYLTNSEWTHDSWTLRQAHNLDFSPCEELAERGEPARDLSFFSGAVAAGAAGSLSAPIDRTRSTWATDPEIDRSPGLLPAGSSHPAAPSPDCAAPRGRR